MHIHRAIGRTMSSLEMFIAMPNLVASLINEDPDFPGIETYIYYARAGPPPEVNARIESPVPDKGGDEYYVIFIVPAPMSYYLNGWYYLDESEQLDHVDVTSDGISAVYQTAGHYAFNAAYVDKVIEQVHDAYTLWRERDAWLAHTRACVDAMPSTPIKSPMLMRSLSFE
jgi:hypothetical protein